ncbi:SulP family inorganic anion transporter [Methylocystis heyeri]|uniref:STAS domain-containing protein n=1 Tax=Methylocystis heyeri TaxID=391905 RepID=A0A6B8KBV5_9HYPH|nr:SulP family inorganic anion transporter [Methylocystis heyeri]QGM45042.1 STAS domain-containing protein [Methylocystis heyeri]
MRLSLFGGLLPFKPREAGRDLLAGVTLASMNIPQVLGYTRIAAMPVVTGLYTVLLPLVAFAIFGSSRHLVVAADSATAAIFSSSLSNMAEPGSPEYVGLVAVVALLTAGLLLLARLFKLGFLANFLSRTVLVGFLTGVGFQVGVAMIGDMLGIETPANLTYRKVGELFENARQFELETSGLSLLVVSAILLGRRFAPRFPVALVAVVGMIAASAKLHLEARIAVIGPVPGGLPSIAFPEASFTQILALLPVAASCFVMIIAQSAATARVYAVRHREVVDENADILGLSAANAAAALSGAFVVNGSPTQTAMAESAGARSQITQLAFAAVVALVLMFLTEPLQYLPRCVLASIVFTIAIGMIDAKALRSILAESRGEFYLAIFTAAAVVFIGVEEGILLAIGLSLIRHVKHSYNPHTQVLAPSETGRWAPAPAKPGIETEPGLIVYRFGADLFYANEERFVTEVRALLDHAPTKIRWFVIDAGAVTDLDYSAAASIRSLLEDLSASGVQIAFGRVSSYLRSDMDRHGVTAAVGERWIFPTLHEALAATKKGAEVNIPALG